MSLCLTLSLVSSCHINPLHSLLHYIYVLCPVHPLFFYMHITLSHSQLWHLISEANKMQHNSLIFSFLVHQKSEHLLLSLLSFCQCHCLQTIHYSSSHCHNAAVLLLQIIRHSRSPVPACLHSLLHLSCKLSVALDGWPIACVFSPNSEFDILWFLGIQLVRSASEQSQQRTTEEQWWVSSYADRKNDINLFSVEASPAFTCDFTPLYRASCSSTTSPTKNPLRISRTG